MYAACLDQQFFYFHFLILLTHIHQVRKSASGHASLERSCALVLLATLSSPDVEPHPIRSHNNTVSTIVEPITIYPDREFIIHDSCLFILQKILHPDPLPLRRLYEVLASLPYSDCYQTVDWGSSHGMYDVADECGYDPWLVLLSPNPEHPLRPYSTFDPLRSPQVSELLSESVLPRTEQSTESHSMMESESSDSRVNLSDCFLGLPTELCLLITQYLPTTDVANIRLVSRAFRASFDHQSFWASRFHHFHERSWFFEALDTPKLLDWRKLYHKTGYTSIDKHLKNRRRIWALMPIVSSTLQLHWHGPQHRADPATIDHSLRAVVKCRKELPGFDIRESSHRYFLHKISVPVCISQIAVSFTKLGDTKYVCGFTIWSEEGPPCHLGYESRDQQYINIKGFNGIIPASTKQGIQAVRFVNHTAPPWLGRPDSCAVSTTLAIGQRVKIIEGGFDGCKMVSLAVAG